MSIRIVILGAGSVGAYVGARLLAGSSQVSFLGRQHFVGAVESGISLSDCFSFQQVIEPALVEASVDAAILSKADYIFVSVKSKDTESAAGLIRQHGRKGAVVLSLQNGIYNADLLASLCSQSVLTGMVPFNVTGQEQFGRAHFHQATQGTIVVEEVEKLHVPIVGAFQSAGLSIVTHADMERVMWSKLLLNMSNGVNALAGVSLLSGLHNTKYRRALALCMNESLRVLKLAGIKPVRIGNSPVKWVPFVLNLPTPLFKLVAKALLTIDSEARSSMLDDLERGREPEVDYINGEVVRLAERLGVAAPINRKVCELVMSASKEKKGSPKIPFDNLSAAIRAD